jgi:hypothetical protein
MLRILMIVLFLLLVICTSSHCWVKTIEGNENQSPKIAVITAVIGGYDDIKEQNNVKHRERADWHYFTDNSKVKSDHWKVTRIDANDIIEKNRDIGGSKSTNYLPNIKDDKVKNMMIAKYFKAQCHKIPELAEYDYFIWVDGSVQLDDKFMDNMYKILVEDNRSLAHFKHSVRNNIKDEVDASYTAYPKKYESQELHKQYNQYIDDGFDDKAGLFEMTIFGRKNTEQNNALFDLWWKENIEKSFQDQISYPYCLWKSNMHPDHIIQLNVFNNDEFSKAAGDGKKHAW